MLKLAPSFPVYMCVFSGVCVFACVSFLPLKASFLLANERPSLCRTLPSILRDNACSRL